MRINTQATYRPSPLRRIQSTGGSSHEQHAEKKKRKPVHSDGTSVKDGKSSYIDQDGATHIDTEA